MSKYLFGTSVLFAAIGILLWVTAASADWDWGGGNYSGGGGGWYYDWTSCYYGWC